jgi:circadian clock protein KaiB
MSEYVLRLFVSGKTHQSEQAIFNLRRICEEEFDGEYSMQIIDILESPELAEEAKIRATPTLIKDQPLPLRRVIGDLSDKDRVMVSLDLLATRKSKRRS